ncbi:hypothetical protein HZC34_03300 [Candidatus Saganbacteria bacterium]|nr:hypothetical protein [Candidatus Saganbacteria bacterium]
MDTTDKHFDKYSIGNKTYTKPVDLGPKAWGRIQESNPGRFVDILSGKFSEKLPEKKVNINK